MELFSIPNGRQVLLAAAQGLRLSLDAVPHDLRVSASTRKTQARGDRVAEKTDVALVEVVAHAIVQQVMTDGSEGLDVDDMRDLRQAIAQGIYEFVGYWDAAVSDTATFTPASRRTTLVVLPLVRLGLLDLALRLQARAGVGLLYFLSGPIEDRAREIVERLAFIQALKTLIGLSKLKRKDVVAEFTEDTFRVWEKGSLPTPAMLQRIFAFLDSRGASTKAVGLELRLAAALVELWSWLDELGIPQEARSAMAEGFLTWLRDVTTLAAKEAIADDERFMTIVRGARNPATATRLATLSNFATDPWFEADLMHLGADWSSRCRSDTARLADIAFAAQEIRRTGDHGAQVEPLSDVTTVALAMCIPRAPYAPRNKLPPVSPSAADLEGFGTAALRHGNPAAAIPLLRDSIRLAPDDPWPRIRLAQALHETGELAAAEDVIRGAIERQGDIADAWLLRGAIVTDAGRPVEALRFLERALVGSHQPAVVYAYLAAALLAHGKHEDARIAAEAGVACDSKNAECWHLRSLALARLGDAKGAAQAADQVRHLGRSPYLFGPRSVNQRG